MIKYFMIAAISCLGLGAMAGNDAEYRGECDPAYGDCPDQGHQDNTTPSDEGTWVCYADNLIVKGFIGLSSDKSAAMDMAMARCENNSQLPCFESLCRQE